MRRWVAIGILTAAAAAFSVTPARADTIGLFDWTFDPFGGPAFEVLNLADVSSGLQFQNARVELNGDSTQVFDLFGDPLDPAGNPSVVSPGFSAITVDDLSQATSAILLLGGVTPTGLLTINYFNVDASGSSAPGTSLLAFGDYATIDYTPVPEPGTLALFGIGALTTAAWRRRRLSRRR